VVAVLLGAATAAVSAADRPLDRSQWLDRAVTSTSDDLRRVPVPKDYHETKGAVVIRNARLFDGTGTKARAVNILIEGSHIARIVPATEDLPVPEGGEALDVQGKTVMPGMIDLHTHLTYVEGSNDGTDLSQADAALRGMERLRYFLESGITSVRDVASHGKAPFVLKQWVADGRIPGPRVFAAGNLITGVGGHGAESDSAHTAPRYPEAAVYEANGPDGFRLAVREQFKRGADLIKLASHFTAEEVGAAVDEAHSLGLKVTVDSETIYTQRAVEAGVDCVEHPLPRSDETIKMMARKGTCADITLVPYQYITAAGGYNFSTSRRFTLTNESVFAMARKLDAAGIKIGIGTDLVFGQYRYLPEPYIQELRNYQALGHKPADALVEATRINAEILGMADRIGTAEVGKLADLIVVDGHPDQSLEALNKIELVMVNGRVEVRDGHVVTPRHVPEKAPYSTAPG